MSARYRTAFSGVKRCAPCWMVCFALAHACSGTAASTPTGAPGCTPDAERTARLTRLLAVEPAAAALVSPDVSASVCFAAGPGTLLNGTTLVLPSEAGDTETAARLAHLLHHVRHGRGLVAGAPIAGSCEAAVDEALREEAAAHVLELSLRAAWSVGAPRRPFANAAEILSLPPEEREEALLAHLRAHPEGGGGYEPLGRDYLERCRASLAR